MKKSKKLLLTALSATLVMSASSAVALTAFADTATKDHEFNGKYDAVFEDFDRADISNTVSAGAGVKTGEKPYLRVNYTAGKSVTPGDAIYKQGSGSLAHVQEGGSIIMSLRAPQNDVDLSEIMFGIRGVDSDAAVLAKPLSELVDSEGESLPALKDEWQTYEISFATSYESTEVYPTSTDSVTGTPLLAIHVFAASATDEGTLDIGSVEYKVTGSSYLNDFIGGDDVQTTAKNADAGTWWAGSSEGYVVKRNINMEAGGSFTVVKDSDVGKYSYAVIEAEGDVANLKVATTVNGSDWGDLIAYDGYSVNLNGNERGFKFVYDGTDENGVTIKRIYLTNVVVPKPAVAVPVIDASTVEVLDDFAVAQTGFTGVWEDMSTAPELAQAGLEFRLSYTNGDKVEVKDGSLVFDATNLAETEWINFKFKSKAPVHGDYIVLKVKGEDGANLDKFSFTLGNPEDVLGEEVGTGKMKAGVDLPVALLDGRNPYKTEDGWYYVVVDLEESGFKTFEGYSIMDMFYRGTGKLYIDNIFFCNAIDVTVPDVEKVLEYTDAKLDIPETVGYANQYMYILHEGYGTTLEFDITPKGDNFDISNFRMEFEGVGVYWASENDKMLITADGKRLNELIYEKDKPTHVVIDMHASGIEGAFMHVHNHFNDIGAFTLTGVKLTTSTPANLVKELDLENAISDNTEKVFTPSQGGYEGAFGYGLPQNVYGKLEFTLVPGAGFDITALRFTGPGEYWFAQHEDAIVTADGKKITELTFEEGTPINFALNLSELGLTASFNEVFFHTAGTDTGAFSITAFKATPYINYVGNVYNPKYAEQMGKLSLVKDTENPEVSITTATTATAGDEITIVYTASDNVTATENLDITVSVKKDGNDVALTGNKFTAEEGVYTVTVTVRDENGNEASDTIQITVTAKTNSGGSSDGLSGGAIAGIVAGCVGAVVIAGAAVYFVMKKKKNS